MSLRPPKPSPLVPGYRLDRYELLCPIAQGGMASVWVARQVGKHGFEKLVAVKTILPEFAEDPRFQKMFLDEAHIAAGIEHPNVTQILDLGEEHSVPYLVMEYVDGDSLSKLHRVVEKKNLAIPTPIVLRVLADACGGLHAAHELRDKQGALLGVVHRDVSPQNILVSTKGAAKLIDFGVAKARDRLGGETNAGMLKGKIHYMAPEQAVGKPIDRRADVWAIGAMLYHLLSGRPPYDGPNQLATLHRLTSGKPPLPLPERVPKPIAELVRRALTHDPDKRVATALDMQQALEAAMVAVNMRASTSDVAAFMREHLAERTEARRQTVDVALASANERARLAEALKIDADPASSSSGLTNVPRRLAAMGLSARPSPSEPPPTVPGIPARLESSSGTNAALVAAEANAASAANGGPKRRSRLVLAGGGAGAVLVLALVFVLGRRSTPSPSEPSGAADPTTASARAVQTAAAPSGSASAAPIASVTPPIEPTTAPTPTVATKAGAPVKAAPKATAVTKATAKPTATATATTTVKKKKVDDGF
ncbi:MAG: serine/threonine protein kinase [Deltaproteobacteria bacterium]|nr:serine/threonine protein kinase [Deltaproteobacteria bacterium]